MPNTYTNLHYHILFSTKNREPLLRNELPRVHDFLGGCIRNLGGISLGFGGVADHVHGLIRLKPTHCIANVLRDIKRASSEWIGERIAGFHWQDGYAAFTVSKSQLARVQHYIEHQEEHHRKKTFADELRELLDANGVEYDERYLL